MTYHVVQTVLPERPAREHVELQSGRAFREDGRVDGNLRMRREHERRRWPGCEERTWPWRTRVNASHCSGVGLPKCTVRVVSIVPSRYCPPESLRAYVRTA